MPGSPAPFELPTVLVTPPPARGITQSSPLDDAASARA
jgi:hypothetical protein